MEGPPVRLLAGAIIVTILLAIASLFVGVIDVSLGALLSSSAGGVKCWARA